jgi:hypothetical protein
MWVCHRCDNPPCILVAHLFLDTAQGNMDDKVSKGRQTRIGPRIPATGKRNGNYKNGKYAKVVQATGTGAETAMP